MTVMATSGVRERRSQLCVFCTISMPGQCCSGRLRKSSVINLGRRITPFPQNIYTSSSSMATVVPCASCYGQRRPQLFGRASGADYMSLFSYRGPHYVPEPRLAYRPPKMTLRQIYRMLKVMKQVRAREAAMINRKQGFPAPDSPAIWPEKRCLPACFRRKRTINIKRVG